HLGGIAEDVVIHRLLRSQQADRRENAERIASQKDEVAGVPSEAGDLRIGDEFDRIAGPRVFGLRLIGVVGLAGYGVLYRVLEERAEADRVEDFRLLLAA